MSENQGHKQTPEQDNKECRQNNDNLDNNMDIEYRLNSDNINEIENSQNNENKECGEDKENRENREHINNVENSEIKENIENGEYRENKEKPKKTNPRKSKNKESNFYKDIPLNPTRPPVIFPITQAIESFLTKKDKILTELRILEVQNRIKNKIFNNKDVFKYDLLFNKENKPKQQIFNEDDIFGLLSGQTFVESTGPINKENIVEEEKIVNIIDKKIDEAEILDESTKSEDMVIMRKKRKIEPKNVSKKKGKRKITYESDSEHIDKYNLDKEKMEAEKLEYLKFKYLKKYNRYEEESDGSDDDDYLLTSVLDGRESNSAEDDEDFVSGLNVVQKKEAVTFNIANRIVNKLKGKDEKEKFRFLQKKIESSPRSSSKYPRRK